MLYLNLTYFFPFLYLTSALPVDEKAFQLFHDMYESVMKTLAQNHMRVHGWDEFGARWYDVMWCDVETGKVERYAYKGLAQ